MAGCGQIGPLYLPTAPEAAQRATLPETLRPDAGTKVPDATAPATASSRNAR